MSAITIRRVSVITPCRNAARLIKRTVESVLRQSAVRSGRVELEYVIRDGGSTDGTVAAIEEAAAGRVVVVSERDSGMYDALAKGMRQVTGDLVAYLNAGDEYFPSAFDVVIDIMQRGRARWLTGLKVLLNEAGHTTRVSLPFRYRRGLIRRGAYGRVLPFIQQESTFWRRDLTPAIDLDRLARFKMAGDCYIWRCLAEVDDLVVVDSLLGGFLVHGGQKSEDMKAYVKEMREICGPLGVWGSCVSMLEAPMWLAPVWLKEKIGGRGVLRWSREAREWR